MSVFTWLTKLMSGNFEIPSATWPTAENCSQWGKQPIRDSLSTIINNLWASHPHTGDFEQIPQLPLSFLLQMHQDLLALGHLLDHALHFRQQLHHALSARRRLAVLFTQQKWGNGELKRQVTQVEQTGAWGSCFLLLQIYRTFVYITGNTKNNGAFHLSIQWATKVHRHRENNIRNRPRITAAV